MKRTYELVLRGAGNMIAAAQNAPTGITPLSQALWHDYVVRLDTPRMLPALKALGYAQASPLAGADTNPLEAQSSALRSRAVLNRFIEPLDSTNQAMLGYNQAANPARLEALSTARDGAALALSPTHLPGTLGFDALYPVYRYGAPVDSVAQRRAALLGYVFAWIDAHRMLQALNLDQLPGISVSVYLGSISYQTEIYGPATPSSRADSGDAVQTDTIPMAGQALILQYDGAESRAPHRISSVALAAGVLLSMLVFRITRLSQTKRRVSERARLDAQLRVSQNEARMHSIVRSAVEAIITIDEEQNIVIFNRMAEDVFRCPATEAIGSPLHRFIPERYRQAHAGHVARFGVTAVTERAMGGQRALSGIRADGQEFPIEASISQISEGGRKLYTVMLRDITERVRAQAALEASRNELRQLSGNIQSVREEEKTRIARELHDDLGQQLTALKMDLSILEASLKKLAQAAQPDAATDAAAASSASATSAPPATPATLATGLAPTARDEAAAHADTPPTPLTYSALAGLLAHTRNMHGLLNSTVASVRRIAADLRPVMLDDLGLAPAIEWLVNDFEARYGVDVRLEMNFDEFEFSNASATAIFRIVQEALTNIARHAQASKVALSLRLEDEQCVIQIADNGRGTELGAPKSGKSFGLLGIRERVHLLDGTLKMTSSPGNGFTLQVTLPNQVLQATRANA
jgi:PAS domain S-box-containing protein